MVLETPKITERQIDELMSPLVMDMDALFKIMRDDVLKLIDEGKEPEEIIHDINRLFGGHDV